jgi:hypothetical protein
MQLTATLPAFVLGSPSSAQVEAVNPDNGTSSQLPAQILAPNPAAATMSVNVAFLEGDPDRPIVLTGSGFVTGADVKWTMNGVTHSLCSANPCNVLSSTTLQAVVPASLLTTAGNVTIAVVNPPAVPGYTDGGSATGLIVTVNNPVPTTTGVTPNSIAIGSTSTQITVTGTNFVSTSVVKWNGASLVSTYVNPSTMKATVPSTSLTATTAGIVTVGDPAPGGGASNAQVIEVTKSGASTSESLVGTGSAGLDGASGTPGSLNATTDGSGLVAVARYSAAPGTPTFNTPEAGTYFDVYAQGSGTPPTTTATIVDCTLNGGNAAYYQDPTTLAWKAVSNQSQSPAGCITMTITNSTSPTLAQMRATGFGIGNDTTPPATTASVSSAANSSGVYLRPITVSLSATDNSGGSGVRAIYYALPPPATSCASATYTPIAGSTAAVAITQPAGAGVVGHTLCYYARDAAGNNETAHKAVYTIDTTERLMQVGHAAFLSASGAHTVTVSAVPGDLLVAVLAEVGSSTTAPALKAGSQTFSLDAAPSPLGGRTQALTFHLSPSNAISSVTVTTPFYNAYDVWVFDVANPVATALDAAGAAFSPTATSMSISTTGATSIANDFVVAAAINDGTTIPSMPGGYASPATLVGSMTKSRVAYSLTNIAGTQTANFGTLATKANIGLAIAAYGGT